jgi:hypothetical protein
MLAATDTAARSICDLSPNLSAEGSRLENRYASVAKDSARVKTRELDRSRTHSRYHNRQRMRRPNRLWLIANR